MKNNNLNKKEQLTRKVDDDGIRLCKKHQWPLRLKTLPVLYGLPSPIVWEIERQAPHHGLWSGIGGCVGPVSNPNPGTFNFFSKTRDKNVCLRCTDEAKNLKAPKSSRRDPNQTGL